MIYVKVPCAGCRVPPLLTLLFAYLEAPLIVGYHFTVPYSRCRMAEEPGTRHPKLFI
jgi:hypothetical protein